MDGRVRRGGVVLLLVLVSGVLTASAAQPVVRPLPPPSAGDVVRALQGLRDAGTGRYERRTVRTLPAGTQTDVWTGEYDLRQRESRARLEARGSWAPRGFTAEFVHTTTASYWQTSSWVAAYGDTWQVEDPPPPGYSPRVDYNAAARSFELMVLLSFRMPDGPVAAEPEGDSWVVTGTVPGLYAAPTFGILDAESGVLAGVPNSVAGLSPARMVLGPDRRVRELRLDGLAFSLDIAEPLPPDLYASLRATTSTIRLSDPGAPVSIQPPPPDKVTRNAP